MGKVPLFAPDAATQTIIAILERSYFVASDEIMRRAAPTVSPFGGYGMPAIWVPATQSYRDPTQFEYQAFLAAQAVAGPTTNGGM